MNLTDKSSNESTANYQWTKNITESNDNLQATTNSNNDDDNVTCSICHKHFFNRFYLKKHRIECHKDISNIDCANSNNETFKQLQQNLNSLFGNSNFPQNAAFNPLLSLYFSKTFPNLPFPPNFMLNLHGLNGGMNNLPHATSKFPDIDINDKPNLFNPTKLNASTELTLNTSSTSTSNQYNAKISTPPNLTTSSNYVSPFDAFKSSMAAAKLADRVTCDICHKDLCNKYFLRTHKLKLHGIQTIDNANNVTNTSNNNSNSNNSNNNNSSSNVSSNRNINHQQYLHNSSVMFNNLRRNNDTNNNILNASPQTNPNKLIPNPFLLQNSTKNDHMFPSTINAASLITKNLENTMNDSANSSCVCPICKRNVGFTYLLPIHLMSVHGINLNNNPANLPPLPHLPNGLFNPNNNLPNFPSLITSSPSNNNTNNNINSTNNSNNPSQTQPSLILPPTQHSLNDPLPTPPNFNPLLAAAAANFPNKMATQNPFFPLSFGTPSSLDSSGSRWYRKSPNQMRVRCDICDKWICNKYFLRTHKLNKHGLTESNGPASSSGTNSEIITPTYNNPNSSTTASSTSNNLISNSEPINSSFNNNNNNNATSAIDLSNNNCLIPKEEKLTQSLGGIFSPARIIDRENEQKRLQQCIKIKPEPMVSKRVEVDWPKYNLTNSLQLQAPLDLSFKQSPTLKSPKISPWKLRKFNKTTQQMRRRIQNNKRKLYVIKFAKKLKAKYQKLQKLSKSPSTKSNNQTFSRNIFLENSQPLLSYYSMTTNTSSTSLSNSHINSFNNSNINMLANAKSMFPNPFSNFLCNNNNNNNEYFSCPFCGKELVNTISFIQHLSQFHEIMLPNPTNFIPPPMNKTIP